MLGTPFQSYKESQLKFGRSGLTAAEDMAMGSQKLVLDTARGVKSCPAKFLLHNVGQ